MNLFFTNEEQQHKVMRVGFISKAIPIIEILFKQGKVL